MIITYLDQNNSIQRSNNYILDQSTKWIDLFCSTKEEAALIEKFLGINIPDQEEMSQIEISERLYVEGKTLYITIVQLVTLESSFPEAHAVTFILHEDRLITVRYNEFKAFAVFNNKLSKSTVDCKYTSHEIFFALLRNFVGILSDTLEYISVEIDSYGRKVFNNDIQSNDRFNYAEILKKIGQQGDLLSKSRESLISLTKAINYALKFPTFNQDKDSALVLETLSNDITSNIDFAQFTSGEVIFILDATLGMIAIEQNNIIKIFSMVSIFFLPPTLIASIYGMNFSIMPELKLPYGYPMAIIAMLLSIYITYKYFKKKKWF